MKIAKILSLAGVLAMTYALYLGFSQGNFFEDGSLILANPWGIVSLIDLYVGFTLFSMWIVFREKNLIIMILWVAAMMILGFFAGALYVFIHLYTSKGDWQRFFFGHRLKT